VEVQTVAEPTTAELGEAPIAQATFIDSNPTEEIRPGPVPVSETLCQLLPPSVLR
jgi:hypothetical protein